MIEMKSNKPMKLLQDTRVLLELDNKKDTSSKCVNDL